MSSGDPDRHEPNGERDPEPGVGSLGVLLVEDDEGDALLVTDELEERLPGARVTRSRTLGDALARSIGDIDCVLLDLGLPDTAGLEAVRRLRAELSTVPLVVLTGLDDEATGVAAVQAGAQDYLVKGRLEPGQLARAIRYSIGRRQTEQAERELLLAEAQAREVERLERGLSPSPLVEDPSVWVASCNRPGRSRALLGGDFFDLVQSDGLLHALVGDVCGHGPDEAAIGVSLRAAWRALTLTGADAQSLLGTMQKVFEHERGLPRLFATLCLVQVDLAESLAELVIAGHPRPMLFDGAEVRSLADARGGRAIGLKAEEWPAQRVALSHDWALLLYTDGIVEGRVGAGSERLGEAGLARLLGELTAADPAWREHPGELLDTVIERVEALNGGHLSDDVAMLLLGSHGAFAKA